METAIQKLIELIVKLSPEVWNILLKQVYIEGFSKLIWGIIPGVLAVFLYKKFDFENCNSEEFLLKILILSGLSAASIYLLIDGTMWLINPQFYAIRWLIEQVH